MKATRSEPEVKEYNITFEWETSHSWEMNLFAENKNQAKNIAWHICRKRHLEPDALNIRITNIEVKE